MRTRVASLIAILVLGAAFIPVEVSARAGGGFSGRGAVASGGRFIAPRAFPRRAGARQAIRQHARFAPFRGHGRFGHGGRFGHDGRFGRHNGRDNGAGVAVIPYYGPIDDPIDSGLPFGSPAVTGAIDPAPVSSNDDPGVALASAPRNCRATVYTVPSESGGMRQVRVTRCYPNGD
jgi:hypothetical protein